MKRELAGANLSLKSTMFAGRSPSAGRTATFASNSKTKSWGSWISLRIVPASMSKSPESMKVHPRLQSLSRNVGAADGLHEGEPVGALVGTSVGPAVGILLGANVGAPVGAAEGVLVGENVGVAVGA